jgi:hypothetical protein
MESSHCCSVTGIRPDLMFVSSLQTSVLVLLISIGSGGPLPRNVGKHLQLGCGGELGPAHHVSGDQLQHEVVPLLNDDNLVPHGRSSHVAATHPEPMVTVLHRTMCILCHC